MNELKSNPKSTLHVTAVPPGGRASAGVREVRIVAFPKEFQKDYWKSMDRRLLMIFFLSLAFLYGPLFYVASRPRAQTASTLDSKTLKKLGQVLKLDSKILDEIDKPKEEEKDETATATVQRGAAPSGNVGKASKVAAAKAAAASRAGKAAKAAAGQGVLAVAGAAGGKNSKYGAYEFSGTSGDLSGVLNQIGSLTTGAGGGGKTQLGSGGVVGGTGGIGELTTELEATGGVSLVAGEEGGGLIGVGKASVSGGAGGAVSAGDIQEVIDKNATSVNSCYQKELKKSPDLKGKLSVQIKVNPAGRVSGVTITTNSVGDAVARCVENKIRGWTFPRGKKGVITVSQTFVFTK